MAKKTALYEKHKAFDAKIVEFAGYDMPIQYSGIMDEHKRVRNTVGVFDVSHMGEFLVTGAGAEDFLNYVTVNDVANMTIGQAQYTAMCQQDGGIVDDLLIYRYEDRFLAVVNAANLDKDWEHMLRFIAEDVEMANISEETTLLAVQGPDSRKTLQKLTDDDLSTVKFYHFIEGAIAGVDATIARTGYTGELGFEIYVENEYAEQLWDAIFDAGEAFHIEPIGLAARDTLRLEMGFCLYGNDIDETTNPIEAGLGWITKVNKGDFLGAEAIKAVQEKGPTRKRIGFELLGRGIPRHDYPIIFSGRKIGHVTSGSQSPMLEKGIGMGYVETEFAQPGTTFNIRIRSREIPAKVVKMPFYSPGKN